MDQPFIIGVTGGSGSGKTYFLKKLLDSFHEHEICLISQDNYYLPRHQQPLDINGIQNYDTPRSIDFEQFAKDIQSLKQFEPVQRLEYTFNNPAIIPKQLEFKPVPIIVVEGIFVFYNETIYKMLDLKIFIDAKEHIKIKRRIKRDSSERGYDLEDVLYRYEHHVAPTYEKYIEPYKHDADIVIPNNSSFAKALEILVVYLRQRIIKNV
ncbi:MAG: uridine kinase [Bacteroidota bacterium]|nr:uridine kinase [Bacteroidota bacterium]